MSATEGRTGTRPPGPERPSERNRGPERPSERNRGPRPYRGRTGQWAFVGHRVSGFLVFFFLLLHIVDVSLVRWPAAYDDVHAVYGNVVLRLFEVGLLIALVFHSLNGLRIVAVDFFPGAVKNERRLLSAVVVMTVVLGLPGAYVIMAPFLRGHL